MPSREEVRNALIEEYEVEPGTADTVISRWMYNNTFADYDGASPGDVAEEIYKDSKVWD